MKVVIQCAGRKNPSAGTFRTADGKPVLFVAHPELAPPNSARFHARPDDVSDDGRSWRTRLLEYNRQNSGNALGLVPAWQLYEPDAYSRLVDRFGLDSVFILSAGWGLIPATFLTPAYDITFSQVAKPQRWKRRLKDDVYDDSCLMPNDGRPWVFLGGREYQPLLCRLTADISGSKTVFFQNGRCARAACGVHRGALRNAAEAQLALRLRAGSDCGQARGFCPGRVIGHPAQAWGCLDSRCRVQHDSGSYTATPSFLGPDLNRSPTRLLPV
jgi:hypothetical protein